jgi:hypothetical protein
MRKRGASFRRNTCLINPLFSLGAEAANRLAIAERIAMDAMLDHKATPDHIGQLETLIETSIRATLIAKRDALPHLDPASLDEALEAFYEAGRAIRRAKIRHDKTGVYGLDAADRAAMIQADLLVGAMRKPNVILRKTWLKAFRESMSGTGVRIPAPEAA